MNKQIICEICGLSVEKNKYERHKKFGHKENKDNSCNMCGKTFTSSYNLQYHIAHHINARSFLCNECPKAYNTASDLAQHQKTHDKGRVAFRCEVCGNLFETRSKYNLHMKLHNATEKQQSEPRKTDSKECPICMKTFVCLKKHNQIVHMNLRNYDCDFCDKKFGKKSGLDRHVLTVHKKEKNFKCEECGKAFGEKAQLKKHERLHLYTYCAKCKDHFEDIKQHNEEKHSNLKHTCSCCFKIFERLRDLESHIKTKHSTIRSYFCDHCDKGFTDKSKIDRHMKVHIRQFLKEASIKKELQFSSDNEVKNETQPDVADSQESLTQCPIAEVKIKEEINDDGESINEDDFNPHSIDEIYFKKEPSYCDNYEFATFDTYDDSDDTVVDDDNKDDQKIDSNQISTNTDLQTKKKSLVQIALEKLQAKQQELANKKKGHKKIKPHVTANQPKRTKGTDIKLPKKEQHEQKSSKMHICDICGKNFSKRYIVRLHMEAVHQKLKYECEICLKKFTAKNTLHTHIKTVHKKIRNHECQFCKKKFGVKSALTTHIKTIHPENPSERVHHQCDICGKILSSYNTLYAHKKFIHEHVEKQKSSYLKKCTLCHEVLQTSHKLAMHKAQVHLNGQQLKRVCGYCKQEFEFYEDFKTHIDSHVGLFICMICDKFYADKESLAFHKNSHKTVDIKLMNFECDYCGDHLLTKALLIVHLKKHVKDFPLHYCDYCGKGFKFESSLYTHRLYHKEGKFPCNYCGKKFVRNFELVVHIRSHTHEKPFNCEICSQRFASKLLLKFHQQTHPEIRAFKCRECKQKFVTSAQLVDHESQFHPESRPYSCFICYKTFKYEHTLIRHSLKHK